MKQQSNEEFEFLDSEEAINDSYNLKFIFYLALLEICEVGGLLFLQIKYNTLVERFQIFEISLFIGIILFAFLLMVWSKSLLNQIRSNEHLQDPTNNFISRLSLILLITFSIFILYEGLLFSYFENITIYNGPLRLALIITQFAIFQCSSNLYKSPNVLRLAIYFHSLILTLLIIYSAIQIQELMQFNEQLQINSNLQIQLPILQIITLILLTINIGTNYANNKKVLSAFSSLFIIMAIFYTLLGCYQLRITENYQFPSDQAPLRGINQNNLVEYGCSPKYFQVDINSCPHIYKAEIWENSNETKEIGCLNQQCIEIADYYIRSKYFIIASNIIISSAILFSIGTSMAIIGIKQKPRKQLNLITQYIIIALYGILLIFFSIIIYQSLDFWNNSLQNIELQFKSNHNSKHLKFPSLEQLDQTIITHTQLSFIDLETLQTIVKGQYQYYNYQVDCNSVNELSSEIPFYQTSMKDNNIYNLIIGTEVTFIVKADKYFTKCANVLITQAIQIEIKLLKKNNYYLNVMLDSNTNSQILSNMNNNCQSGGMFPGCPQTLSKNKQLLQFKNKPQEKVVIFIQNIQQQNSILGQNIFITYYFSEQIYQQYIVQEKTQKIQNAPIIIISACLNTIGQLREVNQLLVTDVNDDTLYPDIKVCN